jgi:m7GpppX diphosphatase
MLTASKKKLLLTESPEAYASDAVQRYVAEEVERPSKQWIHKVLRGQQESEEVRRSDQDFLLLPDTHRTNRKGGVDQSWVKTTLNWLCIPRDCSLRSLRDLRGEHVGLLEKMLRESLECIEAETGIPADEVMAYVHYPPSVYHLHVHFAYPYGQQTHRDPFRVHGLVSVIENLKLDGGYYERISLHVPVHADTCLSGILAKQERS